MFTKRKFKMDVTSREHGMLIRESNESMGVMILPKMLPTSLPNTFYKLN